MPAQRSKHPGCTSLLEVGRLNARQRRIALGALPGAGFFRATGRRRGLTLIELLLTIAVLAILAAVLIPQLSGDLPERLSAASQIVSADLDYARSLAVSNNTSYRI
ncbi:MAG TPA: prepilin-type N-terminal cleavage/methylation domain-containing protein, partial [Pirellulaceae bacterium]|nr:prepilin-type N-terminal cleavage/methylation domain-containing protein [Pirellulaceae bacterium]